MKKHYFVEGGGAECLTCGEAQTAECHYAKYEDTPPPSPKGDGDNGNDTEGDGDGGDGDGDSEGEGEGEGQGDGDGAQPPQEPEGPPERMVTVWGVPHNRDEKCDAEGCVPIEDGEGMVSPGGTFHLRDKPPFHSGGTCEGMGCEPFTEAGEDNPVPKGQEDGGDDDSLLLTCACDPSQVVKVPSWGMEYHDIICPFCDASFQTDAEWRGE